MNDQDNEEKGHKEDKFDREDGGGGEDLLETPEEGPSWVNF